MYLLHCASVRTSALVASQALQGGHKFHLAIAACIFEQVCNCFVGAEGEAASQHDLHVQGEHVISWSSLA